MRDETKDTRMKRTVGWIAVCIALLLSSCTAQEAEPAAPIDPKGEGVLTWEEFAAAPEGERVVLETYVQAAEAWWNGVCSIYTQDRDGAYFLPDASCTMDEAEHLFPGTKLRVTATKSIRNGMPVAEDAQFELLLPETGAGPEEDAVAAKPGSTAASVPASDGAGSASDPSDGIQSAGEAFEAPDPAYFYIAEVLDITEILTEAAESGEDLQTVLYPHLGKYVALRGVSIASPVRYREDGTGEPGNDLFFEGSAGKAACRFQACSYLTGNGTDVYEAAEALRGGETIGLKGFCFWDEGFVLRVTAIEKSE